MSTRPRSGASAGLVARARLRRHWAGMVAVGLLGALVAAGVLATAVGARRTDTAYERLRTATHRTGCDEVGGRLPGCGGG